MSLALENIIRTQWNASPDNSPQAWQTFVDHFERFTGLLCAAAHMGCSQEHEQEFDQLRQWFSRYYGAVAHRVRPGLRGTFGDPGPGASTGDPFESLIQPMRLSELLQQDEGDLIPRIRSISECVYSVPTP